LYILTHIYIGTSSGGVGSRRVFVGRREGERRTDNDRVPETENKGSFAAIARGAILLQMV